MIAGIVCGLAVFACVVISYRRGHANGVLDERIRHIRELDGLLKAMIEANSRALGIAPSRREERLS